MASASIIVNMDDLREKGYTIVPNVLTAEEADKYRGMYEEWIVRFEGVWPPTNRGLIMKFKVGHMEPTWAVRLKAKSVFAQIWGTENLLTSFDAVAISRPPESGDEDFYDPVQDWLHRDSRWERVGLHGYNGGVYLEECECDDWTFDVIEGSHKYVDEYYNECEYAVEQRKRNPTWQVKNYRPEDVVWFKDTYNCDRKRIPVPKGGMLVWDTRVIHANARPIIHRKNAGRWRYVVLVCMAPAVWANEADRRKKKEGYTKMLMTNNWPCNGISFFKEREPDFKERSISVISELPPSAKTKEAQQLAGVLPYRRAPEDRELLRKKPIWRN